MYRCLLAAWALSVMPAIYADNVFKCTDQDGKVRYQKERCEDARHAEEKYIDPNHNVIKLEVPQPSEPSAEPTKPASTAGTPPPAKRKHPY